MVSSQSRVGTRDVRSIWLVRIELAPADGTNSAAEIRGSRHAPWQLCYYATQLRFNAEEGMMTSSAEAASCPRLTEET